MVEIDPGETASFRVSLHPLTDAEAVSEMSERIETLAATKPARSTQRPRPGWSPGSLSSECWTPNVRGSVLASGTRLTWTSLPQRVSLTCLLDRFAFDHEDRQVACTLRAFAAGVLVLLGVDFEFALDGHRSSDEVGRLAGHHFDDHTIEQCRTGTETTLLVVADQHELIDIGFFEQRAGQDVPAQLDNLLAPAP